MRRSAAAHASLTAWVALLLPWTTAALPPGPLPGRPTVRAGERDTSRFAVSFHHEHKDVVRSHLAQKGYQVLYEGPGFFSVAATHTPAPPPLPLPPDEQPAGAGAPAAARRKLVEQAHQQAEREQHVALLGAIPGVQTSEQDLRRFLHVRPTPRRAWHQRHDQQQQQQQKQKQQWRPGDAATAGAGLRRLASASAPAAGSAPSDRLAGHWHHGGLYRPSPYDTWGNSVSDAKCASEDTPLGDAAGAEVVPWGIRRIGALNATVRDEQPKGRVIVCIIDSGIEASHPEYKPSISPPPGGPRGRSHIDGCGAGPNCPYTWSSDVVGHGTHVAGTIGAEANGLGVIGVMSGGADIHMVRIWNDSGDVSQGQGPFATDLVLAYDNCLSYLQEQQKSGDKKTKMVINMSYGSAGPLTVERLWITKAASRGDMLFVGSAGNNGSWLDSSAYVSDAGGAGARDLAASGVQGQYMSYPASYELAEVLSVANARCDDTIDYSSQKNKAVSIAAPGMAILSSVPEYYGVIRAHLATSWPLPNQTEPRASGGGSGSNDGGSAPASAAAPGETRRGLGFLTNGYKEPRPVQGTRVGSSGMLPLAVCSIESDVRALKQQGASAVPSPSTCAGASGAVCLTELPGGADWYHETCLAMLQCVRSGGKGLAVWRKDESPNGGGDPDPPAGYYYGLGPDDFLLGTQVNCGAKCGCWGELKKVLGCPSGDCAASSPPAAVVSAHHARALLDASRAGGAKEAGPLQVNVTNYQYNYRHYDGTSMSAPHVSGAAALLWRLAPDCRAADIAHALKASAERVDQSPLAAGAGMLRVDLAFDWIRKNKDCAKAS